ncbi:NIF family HAD-type phosphatase [Sphingomonas sp. ERG5]|uniref:NIF family HAD-type phosphatase n=1 Tax=Sphingomonas sp. ERG5 TaxID=1381597 RepID=UPI00054BDB17|nr:HAD family hydrolase [Sphingomonas sp. ERG5]
MPLSPAQSSKLLLILDLDETLIYATEKPLDRPADFSVYGYHVYRRPHLDAFLAECARHFDLAVWSSASDDYVRAVVDRIFPDPAALHFVWGRSKATLRRVSPYDDGYMLDPWDHLHYVKPLAKVKKRWPLQRVLILDDTPQKCVRNYGNAIYPRVFEGAEDDTELSLLARYLPTLKDEANVRTIEKRRWREGLLPGAGSESA